MFQLAGVEVNKEPVLVSPTGAGPGAGDKSSKNSTSSVSGSAANNNHNKKDSENTEFAASRPGSERTSTEPRKQSADFFDRVGA